MLFSRSNRISGEIEHPGVARAALGTLTRLLGLTSVPKSKLQPQALSRQERPLCQARLLPSYHLSFTTPSPSQPSCL